MSELSEFAAHARAMAKAIHRPDCSLSPLAREFDHRCTDGCTHPEPHCRGCVTRADRVLWVRLAEEAEAFMNRHEEGMLL